MGVLYGVGIAAYVIVVAALFFIAHHRRVIERHVSVRDGMLVTRAGSGAKPHSRAITGIGAVVHVGSGDTPGRHGSGGFWTGGGLLILNHAGSVVQNIPYGVGLSAPLRQLAAELEVPVHRDYDEISRGAFLAEFPGALRVGQLWSPLRWAVTTFVVLFGVIPAAGVALYVVMTIVDSLHGLA